MFTADAFLGHNFLPGFILNLSQRIVLDAVSIHKFNSFFIIHITDSIFYISRHVNAIVTISPNDFFLC